MLGIDIFCPVSSFRLRFFQSRPRHWDSDIFSLGLVIETFSVLVSVSSLRLRHFWSLSRSRLWDSDLCSLGLIIEVINNNNKVVNDNSNKVINHKSNKVIHNNNVVNMKNIIRSQTTKLKHISLTILDNYMTILSYHVTPSKKHIFNNITFLVWNLRTDKILI